MNLRSFVFVLVAVTVASCRAPVVTIPNGGDTARRARFADPDKLQFEGLDTTDTVAFYQRDGSWFGPCPSNRVSITVLDERRGERPQTQKTASAQTKGSGEGRIQFPQESSNAPSSNKSQGGGSGGITFPKKSSAGGSGHLSLPPPKPDSVGSGRLVLPAPLAHAGSGSMTVPFSVRLDKRADKARANWGDTVLFTVTASNDSDLKLDKLVAIDRVSPFLRIENAEGCEIRLRPDGRSEILFLLDGMAPRSTVEFRFSCRVTDARLPSSPSESP